VVWSNLEVKHTWHFLKRCLLRFFEACILLLYLGMWFFSLERIPIRYLNLLLMNVILLPLLSFLWTNKSMTFFKINSLLWQIVLISNKKKKLWKNVSFFSEKRPLCYFFWISTSTISRNIFSLKRPGTSLKWS